MVRTRLRLIVASLLLSLVTTSAPAAPEEKGLSSVIEAISSNQLDLALKRVDGILAERPNFRLAHLIRGDLLMARTKPIDRFGNVAKTVPQERVDELRAEALARLRAQRERPNGDRLPRYVVQMQPAQKYAVVVDSKRSRLYLYENVGGEPRLARDYYVTLGKRGIFKTLEGDQKTPIGVYHVTGNMSRQKLPDLYGSGAYSINYPNEWDRRHGRNGHGIWLHGVPRDTFSRPPWASDGCIALSNPDLDSLGHLLQIGLTPVIIADEVEWVEPSVLDLERKSLSAAIEAWRADWESRDTERYLSHYSARLRAGDRDLAAWTDYKRKVNGGKSWIKVGLSALSMFRYPREGDFVVVTFDQDYRSSNLSATGKKRQYWTREGGQWKILYEGGA